MFLSHNKSFELTLHNIIFQQQHKKIDLNIFSNLDIKFELKMPFEIAINRKLNIIHLKSKSPLFIIYLDYIIVLLMFLVLNLQFLWHSSNVFFDILYITKIIRDPSPKKVQKTIILNYNHIRFIDKSEFYRLIKDKKVVNIKQNIKGLNITFYTSLLSYISNIVFSILATVLILHYGIILPMSNYFLCASVVLICSDI